MRKNYTAAVYVLDNARATDGIVACRLLLKRLDLKAEQEIRELDNGEHNNLEMLMKWWGFENQDKLLIVGTWRDIRSLRASEIILAKHFTNVVIADDVNIEMGWNEIGGARHHTLRNYRRLRHVREGRYNYEHVDINDENLERKNKARNFALKMWADVERYSDQSWVTSAKILAEVLDGEGLLTATGSKIRHQHLSKWARLAGKEKEWGLMLNTFNERRKQ